MKKYQCIRKCHDYGKKWNVGDILEIDVKPSHHFVIVAGQENLAKPVVVEPVLVPEQRSTKRSKDPMKPVSNEDKKSFSEMQSNSGGGLKTGMAAGLKEDKPISMRDLKK